MLLRANYMSSEVSRSKLDFTKRAYVDDDIIESNVIGMVVLVGAGKTILRPAAKTHLFRKSFQLFRSQLIFPSCHRYNNQSNRCCWSVWLCGQRVVAARLTGATASGRSESNNWLAATPVIAALLKMERADFVKQAGRARLRISNI